MTVCFVSPCIWLKPRSSLVYTRHPIVNMFFPSLPFPERLLERESKNGSIICRPDLGVSNPAFLPNSYTLLAGEDPVSKVRGAISVIFGSQAS